MGFLMARCAEGDQILGSVIPQSTPPQNVMDLKAFDAAARLATPAISLQDLAAESPIGFRIKPQSWSFRAHPSQRVIWTFSTSCLLWGFGRPITSRVSESNKASCFPASKLTPARKSAQIISKQ
jgi:hypothetical protein